MVSGVDCLPDWDSALLIGAGLSDTTAYQATVYRLSVGPIRERRKEKKETSLRFYTWMALVLKLRIRWVLTKGPKAGKNQPNSLDWLICAFLYGSVVSLEIYHTTKSVSPVD